LDDQAPLGIENAKTNRKYGSHPILTRPFLEVLFSHSKDVSWMATPRLCKFYRDICKLYVDSGSTDTAQSFGYCDLDSDQTTCRGGLDACQKSDTLKRYYFEEIKREGGLEWERKRNLVFSQDMKP
jgi:hypothetical protein